MALNDLSYSPLIYTIFSVVIVSLISFIGILMLAIQKKLLNKILIFLVSFAVGALIGDAFIHLLPEAIEEGIEPFTFGKNALIGIIIFFLLEKFMRWHHRHVFDHKEEHAHKHQYVQPYVWMNLFGDGLHNFIDGMIIAGSYLISLPLGLASTIAVVIHEGAQEIGDFAVLIKGGLSQGRALFYNFLSALTALIGGLAIFLIGTNVENLESFLIPFTFAGFIYIALGSLIPELHHEDTFKKLIAQLAGMLLGVGIMASLLYVG